MSEYQIYQTAIPGTPYAPADTVAFGGFVRNLNHTPIGIVAPSGPAPWQPPEWLKVKNWPGFQTINHGGKSPRQR